MAAKLYMHSVSGTMSWLDEGDAKANPALIPVQNAPEQFSPSGQQVALRKGIPTSTGITTDAQANLTRLGNETTADALARSNQIGFRDEAARQAAAAEITSMSVDQLINALKIASHPQGDILDALFAKGVSPNDAYQQAGLEFGQIGSPQIVGSETATSGNISEEEQFKADVASGKIQNYTLTKDGQRISGFYTNEQLKSYMDRGFRIQGLGTKPQLTPDYSELENDLKSGAITPAEAAIILVERYGVTNIKTADSIVRSWGDVGDILPIDYTDVPGGYFGADLGTGDLNGIDATADIAGILGEDTGLDEAALRDADATVVVPKSAVTGIGDASALALSEQRGDPLRRRLFGERYPTLQGTPFGSNILGNLASQFQRYLPIASFGKGALGGSGFANPADESAAFQSFMQNRPTSSQIGTELSNILRGVQTGTVLPDIFQSAFSTAGAESPFLGIRDAFQSAIAPIMADTGPRFQKNLERVLRERLENQMAANPEMFVTPQQIFSSFRKYIPEFEGFNLEDVPGRNPYPSSP